VRNRNRVFQITFVIVSHLITRVEMLILLIHYYYIVDDNETAVTKLN